MVNEIDYENKASVCEELLGLHAFTGCNITNALHCHRKVKALRAMLKLDSVVTWVGMGNIARATWWTADNVLNFLHGYLIPGNLQDKESTTNKVSTKKMGVNSSN